MLCSQTKTSGTKPLLLELFQYPTNTIAYKTTSCVCQVCSSLPLLFSLVFIIFLLETHLYPVLYCESHCCFLGLFKFLEHIRHCFVLYRSGAFKVDVKILTNVEHPLDSFLRTAV